MNMRFRIVRRVALACAVGLLLGLQIAVARGQNPFFPGDEWETLSAEQLGWSTANLDKALDFGMSRQSSSIVVVHSGRIVAERHTKLNRPSLRYSAMKPGQNPLGHPLEDVASVQKSVVSFLAGVALDRGLIRLEDPVHQHLGMGWSKATGEQESAITLRHLMTMTSGLNEALEFVAPAGTKWAYNTNAYAKSLTCLESASHLTANELTKRWLLDKVGMKDSSWVERAQLRGTEAGANRYGFVTSARDLARFGMLIIEQGRWRDEQLVSVEYLRVATSPSQDLNPSYGLLWWLNGQSDAVRGARKAKGPLIPSAPDDLVAALGALGRKCYVVPSLDLVVTRLGDDPNKPAKAKFDDEFWRLLMLAIPH